MNPNRFSENSREYLQEYKNAKKVSEQKAIIQQIISNEQKCLQENQDLLVGMRNFNNTKSTRELLHLALCIVLAIAAGYFVFTFLVAASVISVPIFVFLCIHLATFFVKGIGYSPTELSKQIEICNDKNQLIIKFQAELERLNVPDSEKIMEKSSRSEKSESTSVLLQPARQVNKESPDTDNGSPSYLSARQVNKESPDTDNGSPSYHLSRIKLQ
ncbi:MAG: hypothetical protein WAL30_00585 [Candidatus Aquirickettsiella sp.]